MIHTLQGQLSSFENPLSKYPPVKELGELVDLVENQDITQSSAKLLLRELIANPTHDPRSVRQLADDMELTSSTNNKNHDILTSCRSAIQALPREVASVRAGRVNAVNKLVGWVLRDTRGRANAQEVKTIIVELLSEK
jgi:aspartyl-tRNA(Asn)/glutamyl-tRNA(Gln) amidotransferase subunit B